ncbi:MAG: 50S ribosomal protein L29 [Terriglobia bacterium]
MKAEKIRELSEDELKARLQESREQMFRLRFQMATGQTEGLSKLRTLRKDIARMKTIGQERKRKAATAEK